MMKGKELYTDIYNRAFQHSLKIIELSQKAKSECDVVRIMTALQEILHFDSAAILVVNKEEGNLSYKKVINHSYEQNLIDACVENKHSHLSFMVDYVITFNNPVVWNDLWQPRRCPPSFGMIGSTRCFGDAQGIMFPFPIDNNDYVIAVVSMQFKKKGENVNYGNRFLYYINALLQYPCEAVGRIFVTRRESGVNHLTSREIEVLEWAAKGKTAWEIAMILSISERTVKFHLTNTYQKLNVVNRQQAITKALHAGIFPD